MSRRFLTAVAAGLLLAGPARAGMGTPLPTDWDTVYRLNDVSLQRLQTISFFLLVFLVCTAVLWGLWNYLRRDFAALPRLSYGRALAGMFLLSLLFVFVLTMITGARELMTPGAWKKQGWTYKLANETAPAAEPSPRDLRRQQLEKLRTALWQYAATHQGRFPGMDDLSAIPAGLWEIPASGGMCFQYVGGQSADYAPHPLVYELEVDTDRLVLRTDGVIVSLKTAELALALKGGKGP
jgi:hypothetical protein